VVTERLERAFGDTMAVDGVDLTVQKGEIYGFLGPNGAGKSTLVRVLCTLLLPTAGRALVAGHDVAGEPDRVRLGIGVALQEAALDDRQTGVELLALQGRLYGLGRGDVERRVVELRSLIDIGEALDHRIGTYSSGMKRRLDLAAALVHDPDVLFLDEPTTGLDPQSRAKVWEEVRRLNTELGMTIFLTTQYLEEADELADRVGIIDRGRLVAEGAPAALKRSIGSDVIVAELDPSGLDASGLDGGVGGGLDASGLGGGAERAVTAVEGLAGVDRVDRHGCEVTIRTADGAALLSPVAVALNESRISVRNLTLRTPTLDDVFLQLTGAHIREGDQP